MPPDEPLTPQPMGKAQSDIDPIWLAAAAGELLRHEVQVWCADLNVSPEVMVRLRQSLSPDEENRARRFCFDRDRHHFIAARGILRSVLSRYVGLEPSQLQFDYSPRGKPFLNPPSEICFNLSHSQGWALYAVAFDRVGIDLEYIRPVETLQLAKRFFSAREYTALCALPAHQQQFAFFQAWTCKEAYLKATGDGLVHLEQVEVTMVSDRASPSTDRPQHSRNGKALLYGFSRMQLIHNGQNGDFDDRWLFQPIHLTADYAATLALERAQANITYWKWVD